MVDIQMHVAWPPNTFRTSYISDKQTEAREPHAVREEIQSGPQCCSTIIINNKTKTNKLRGLSPQANYTDRETAAFRRS
jgi:hypothetical protein